MKYFAMIVDNEVVESIRLPEIEDITPNSQKPYVASELERVIAIYSSDPRIIPTDEPVEKGSIWNGTSFIPPVE